MSGGGRGALKRKKKVDAFKRQFKATLILFIVSTIHIPEHLRTLPVYLNAIWMFPPQWRPPVADIPRTAAVIRYVPSLIYRIVLPSLLVEIINFQEPVCVAFKRFNGSKQLKKHSFGIIKTLKGGGSGVNAICYLSPETCLRLLILLCFF